jgi:hypothetical protein
MPTALPKNTKMMPVIMLPQIAPMAPVTMCFLMMTGSWAGETGLCANRLRRGPGARAGSVVIILSQFSR